MDIFCQAKTKLKNEIIYETKNFYLIHDGFPLTEGHLLIIPKKHERCFLEITGYEKKEAEELITKAINFLKNNYIMPRLFEHGVIAQTVPHAHLHLLPTTKKILKDIKKVAEKVKRSKVPYLYYYQEKEMYFSVKGEITPGYLHSSFAKALSRPIDGKLRAKDAQKWILKVKKKWNSWLLKQEK